MKIKRMVTNWINKLNPAQEDIVADFGETQPVSNLLYNNQTAYNKIEVVNRGVNLIVDSAAGIKVDIGEIIDQILIIMLTFSGETYILT